MSEAEKTVTDFADHRRRGDPREPRERREPTAEQLREKYLNLALMRGARDEAISTTIARAETIRSYIETGVSPEPC